MYTCGSLSERTLCEGSLSSLHNRPQTEKTQASEGNFLRSLCFKLSERFCSVRRFSVRTGWFRTCWIALRRCGCRCPGCCGRFAGGGTKSNGLPAETGLTREALHRLGEEDGGREDRAIFFQGTGCEFAQAEGVLMGKGNMVNNQQFWPE